MKYPIKIALLLACLPFLLPAQDCRNLAKYHEHISKDLSAARRCCDGLPDNDAREHRRRRIENKLQHRRVAADEIRRGG